MIVAFGFDAPGLALRVPDRELARDVGGLFPDYLRDEASGAAPRPLLVVRRVPEGHRLEGDPSLLDSGERGTVRSRVELLSRIEIALTRGLLRLRAGLTHLHAAGASLPGGAVLAFGPAEAGKSTLALAWTLAGRPLLGDDVLLLDRQGRIRPFRRLMKVDPVRLEEFGISRRETPHWADGYDGAWFDPREAGGWCRGPVRPRLVAFLDRSPGVDLEVRELEPPRTLALLLDGVMESGASSAESLDPLLALLEGAHGVRISYGESARAAKCLAEHVVRRAPALARRSRHSARGASGRAGAAPPRGKPAP